MKKISIVCLSGLLFFTACENTGSSTVGTYEKEETTQSSEKTEHESHGGQVKETTEGVATEGATTDTLKTSGDAPHEGSGVEIKTGETVPADTTSSKAIPKR